MVGAPRGDAEEAVRLRSGAAAEGAHGTSQHREYPPIDPSTESFPMCLVWTPIPVLTWFLPFIGHLGLAASNGCIYDFAGPYFIGEGELAFGSPARYIRLDRGRMRDGEKGWDDAVRQANAVYGLRMHNLCFQNCHSHVATAMDGAEYRGFSNWNMIILAAWMFFCGSFVGVRGFLRSFLPSLVLYVAAAMLYFGAFSSSRDVYSTL